MPAELSTTNDPLLTEKEIEQQTDGKLKAATLRNWRSLRKHTEELPFVRVGARIYYRKSVLEAYLTGSTSRACRTDGAS